MSTVLVVNCGSSSIKYQLIDMVNDVVIARGLIERIGTDQGVITHIHGDSLVEFTVTVLDHFAGFEALIAACELYGPDLHAAGIIAVGHRVVQGGARFIAPTILDDTAVATLTELTPLAPLHHPANLQGIRGARLAFPDVPHVAVFDTAFHQTMPPEAYTYAIDRVLAQQYRIRRYGFHGTSHRYVRGLAAEFLERPLEDVNSIVLHLGNGCSACAVRGGKSVETSMGMTPLEGLVMGSRSGDLDPSIMFHLARQAKMTPEQIDDLLNRRSGLMGLIGNADVRDLIDGVRRGGRHATLALDVYCHRIKHYIGAYYALLGHLDCIVFTAGVGENSPEVREKSVENMQELGIEIDAEKNFASRRDARDISTDGSRVRVLVIPTNEELEIARETLATIGFGL